MIIIKNQINFIGKDNSIKGVLKKLRSEKSAIDFSKIIPMDEDKDDLSLDYYMNLCCNIYIEQHPEKKQDLIKTFEFVGITRQVPYKFKLLEKKELCSARSKYQTSMLIKDAENFINKIKSKAIFNGYMVRDALWGTGSGAYNPQVRKNSIEFTTFDKAPVLLFMKLSEMCPDVKIEYTYYIDEKQTKLSLQNGSVEYLIDETDEEPILFSLISENVRI